MLGFGLRRNVKRRVAGEERKDALPDCNQHPKAQIGTKCLLTSLEKQRNILRLDLMRENLTDCH